ncbi:MAG TPA: cation:proton antiporter, partial [Candidatus Aminicenantes bacterium]|nr:cation:proton antiporter [Candidatus Aminicenantes bacterium]
MNAPIFLEILIMLACAIAVIPFFHRLRIPAVVGYLLTGVLVGPSVLRLVSDSPRLDALADIGVVMLLFTIGLELSGDRIAGIRKPFWLGGSAQVLLTGGVVVPVALGFHVPFSQGVFFGFLISLSSTVIVLRLLAERAEVHAPQGKLALGILLFQDLSVVPMMISIPFLAGNHLPGQGGSLLGFLLHSLLLIALLLLIRWMAPRWMVRAIRTRIREIYVLVSLLFCLGLAYLTSRFGFSPALGAFLAGIIIAESPYSHQIAADVLPFKDLFSSLFFISIGMMLDLRTVASQLGLLLVLLAVLVLLKTIVVTGIVRGIMRFPWRIAVLTGVLLSQVGEFSFVLGRMGTAQGILSPEAFQRFMAVAVMSILSTPLLLQGAPALATLLGRSRSSRPLPASPALAGHVVIAGFGLNGQNLARVLKAAAIPFMVIELNYDRVRACQEQGIPILFGDVCSREILTLAGVPTCKVFVGAISDPRAAIRALKTARDLNPQGKMIVRTRYVSGIDELYRAGADQVIPEEFETSIEIFTRTLAEYHIPRNLIRAQTEIIRSERYAMMRDE